MSDSKQTKKHPGKVVLTCSGGLDRAAMIPLPESQPTLQDVGLVYNGQRFTAVKDALDASVDKPQEPVTGDVRLTFCKGTREAVGFRSPRSLYDEDLDTFDAEGINRLHRLGQMVAIQRPAPSGAGCEVAR